MLEGMDLAHHHAVQFYGNEDSLFATVAGFLGAGMISGQPALIIGTPGHCKAILEVLETRLIDVERALRTGDLVVIDAQETLGLFMVDDMPDAYAFETNLGRFIDQMLQGRSTAVLRAYGEMVDVLWKDGLCDAAIRLEILWNQLAVRYGFALLCGYAMGNFYKQTERFQEVCRQHTHIIEPNSKVVPMKPRRARIA
jgi:hypothetical protein